ncbi:MAG: NADH-quinone oxidoreductase subunit E [Hoeflea sp.]|uniref:NADH-quinone oxidoreductase subunit E n=1 Tax=Hoeflea sp. TaxID=1940281 RepID=UPI001DF997F7|nr:NADH-quinone oxidoreductase subunit E [Hoeflea sp.]MBU4530306.1 NADH-quinone oxidoreductase subunit E [Alphaproteobacteria bacterium]MBU4545093.1 NADH-quinone oxidoreductase subunit E [Alphaproteobacteria bacterium]MBU4549707.1 NADH-quinone oxidoreductase subunit E [Alphaproteobacteria bacterium]MBV1721896.1 NADH-quinone oxidoreductase subunit E [Hoeflea sp.]MBV1761246.1 NADH-quinone oxidoreductase subunit E [Hoeflea sp.]
MSVRRLAEDTVQPAEFAFNRDFAAQAKVWIKKYPKERAQSAVIPLLMLAQEQDGWVTKRAIETVADMLGMPYIRALEVATFYTQFQLKPVGSRAHVQVCGTTPCMLRGSEALMDVCRAKIHPEPFHLNASGTLSWEEVECQGACVNAPMVMIFKDSYEDLSPERLAYIIERFEAGRPGDITPGTQIDRINSAPAGGLTSLTKEIKPVIDGAAKGAGGKSRSPAATKAGRPERPTTETETQSPDKAKANVEARSKTADEIAEKPALDASHELPSSDKSSSKARVGSSKKSAKQGSDPTKPETENKQAVESDVPTEGRAGAAAVAPKLDDRDRPAGIARPDAPDDLKMISGVGPKIEGILNSLGIYTYAQVAAWQKAERDWVDGYLKFKGRIEREDWVRQAEALAKGGEAEYIRVFGKKPR